MMGNLNHILSEVVVREEKEGRQLDNTKEVEYDTINFSCL